MEAMYADKSNGLHWPYVFSLPGWMSTWWDFFGAGFYLSLIAVRDGDRIVGIAPFKLKDSTASFIGDDSVCDYLDFIVVPGKESVFSEILIGECVARGISRLDLSTLRPDSVAWQYLLPMARKQALEVECREADVSYEMPLPDSFDAYLKQLTSKQRHELLRKQRNLEMEAGASFSLLQDSEVTEKEMDMFLSLMAGSRKDKAEFLTANMKNFFKGIGRALAAYSVLRLGFLKIGTRPVAVVLGFDYNNYVYLYNSGYNPDYNDLSVGLISKTAFIRWSIEHQKSTFDFLKGLEVYKERLGGKQVNLSACSFSLEN